MAAALLMVVASACGAPSEEAELLPAREELAATLNQSPTTTTAAPAVPTTTASPNTTATVPAEVVKSVQAAADAPATTATPPTAARTSRTVHEQAWTPFASADGVVLRHPSSRVELIGYHQSNLDGARQLDPLATSAPHVTLEGRSRDTGSRTAADVVVDPDTQIRAPVTGTVSYAGSYILYCNTIDHFLIIDPDDHRGWEVKLLHFEGLQVKVGDPVIAGQTIVGSRARKLPFQSQVDEVTASPAWPHVHIEIDDPTIPDRPSPDRGC